MFDTPKTIKNEGVHSTCPSPPRPETNFVNTNTPSSVRQSPVPSAVRRDPPARGPPTLTFTSLASPSLTLMHDDEEEEEYPSSSSSENGFFLLSPAGATRPIFYYPTAVRINSTTNAVLQSRYPVIRLQPRRSSSS
eukprot:scaffold10013_cov79-Skeletonema_dohrnii-CCMP3373.AAC.39